MPEEHDRVPRRAIADLRPAIRAAWRTKYLGDDGAELRAVGLLERAEAALRAEGQPTTIRTLWMHLAARAAAEGDADTRAAAALAGVALGLGMN